MKGQPPGASLSHLQALLPRPQPALWPLHCGAPGSEGRPGEGPAPFAEGQSAVRRDSCALGSHREQTVKASEVAGEGSPGETWAGAVGERVPKRWAARAWPCPGQWPDLCCRWGCSQVGRMGGEGRGDLRSVSQSPQGPPGPGWGRREAGSTREAGAGGEGRRAEGRFPGSLSSRGWGPFCERGNRACCGHLGGSGLSATGVPPTLAAVTAPPPKNKGMKTFIQSQCRNSSLTTKNLNPDKHQGEHTTDKANSLGKIE